MAVWPFTRNAESKKSKARNAESKKSKFKLIERPGGWPDLASVSPEERAALLL